MSRKRRGNKTRYLGEREIRGRLGLDEAARSQKTEPHNRRKPTVGGVGSPELADNAVGGRALASGATNAERAVDTGHTKDLAVVRSRITGGAVSTAELASGAVARTNISGGAVGLDEIGDGAKNPGQTVAGLRSIRNQAGANSVLAAAGDHTHSMSFKELTAEIRRPLLELRRRVRADRDAGAADAAAVSRLRHLTLALAHLLMDDGDVTAEEHEERLTSDSAYRSRWLETRKDDHGDGQFVFRPRGGHYAAPHPDVRAATEEGA